MARYYIDTDDGTFAAFDREGYDLASANEARELAMAALPTIARDGLDPMSKHSRFSVTVRSEMGAEIYLAELQFSERWIARPTAV